MVAKGALAVSYEEEEFALFFKGSLFPNRCQRADVKRET